MWDALRTSGTSDLQQFLLGRWHPVNPASQSGAGTANLATSSSLWLELDCHVRAAQLCTGRWVAIFLCLSLPAARVYSIHLQWPYGEDLFYLRRSFTIGTFSGPLGFLRYDSIWDELQLLSCMTYRLSIPTPLEGGIESHHHCGSILLQRLDSNFHHHHRTNFDNENGNWYELYCQLFLLCLPFRELEWQSRLYGWLESGWSCTIFFALPHLISLHIFDDNTVA